MIIWSLSDIILWRVGNAKLQRKSWILAFIDYWDRYGQLTPTEVDFGFTQLPWKIDGWFLVKILHI